MLQRSEEEGVIGQEHQPIILQKTAAEIHLKSIINPEEVPGYNPIYFILQKLLIEFSGGQKGLIFCENKVTKSNLIITLLNCQLLHHL
jgi:hypothetical protein